VLPQHFTPRVPKDSQTLDHLADTLCTLELIAFVEPHVKVQVQAPKHGGHFAAGLHVQADIQLMNNGLGAADVIVDTLIELQRIATLESHQRALEKPEGTIIKHGDESSRAGGFGSNAAIRSCDVGLSRHGVPGGNGGLLLDLIPIQIRGEQVGNRVDRR